MSATLTNKAREFLEQMQKKLIERSLEVLREVLHLEFATLEDVLSLCQIRLRHSHFSIAMLQEKLGNSACKGPNREDSQALLVQDVCNCVRSSDYVWDCELIAEIAGVDASSRRSQEISNFYANTYRGFAYKRLRAYICMWLTEEIVGDTILDFAYAHLLETVFDPSPFQKTAMSYHPALGRTFDAFLRQKLIWRSLDAAKAISRKRVELQQIERHACIETSTDFERVNTVIKDIQRELSMLACIRSSSGRELGQQARAVFELRYKAYLNPRDMASSTRQMVANHFSNGLDRIRSEYQEAIDKLKQLTESDIPKAQNKLDYTWAVSRVFEERLGVEAYSRDRILEIAEESLTQKIQELLERKKKCRGRHGGRLRRELDYAITCKRHDLAQRALERQFALLTRWRGLEKPWIRSHDRIGGLIGLSQPTIWRLWNAASTFFTENRGKAGQD